jgi:putative endonuclease
VPPRPDPVAGRAAEAAAAEALTRAGYRVLARNCVTPFGEIDIVAERRGTLTFVEVKARRPNGLAGSPEEALRRTKIRRVARAAAHLAASKGLAGSPREFLGVAVDLTPEGAPGAVRLVPVEDVA